MLVCVYTSDFQSQKKGAVFLKSAHSSDLIKHFLVVNACIVVDEKNLE